MFRIATQEVTETLPSYLVKTGRNSAMFKRPRGSKTFFKLNSAEHEIYPANKSQITNKPSQKKKKKKKKKRQTLGLGLTYNKC